MSAVWKNCADYKGKNSLAERDLLVPCQTPRRTHPGRRPTAVSGLDHPIVSTIHRELSTRGPGEQGAAHLGGQLCHVP